MIDPNAPPTVTADDTATTTSEIVDESIANASRALDKALGDDDTDWLRTVVESLEGRSDDVKKALGQALLDGQDGVGPLLAPTPPKALKTAEILDLEGP